MGKTIVMAFGGNAITPANQKGFFEEQLSNVQRVCQSVVAMVQEGHRVILTHGNGPQVGSILLKNELAKNVLPPMPLDVCVSNTQGSIGYAIQQKLTNAFRSAGIDRPVASVVTQVVVDSKDPAFQNPTKPIGPFYSEEEAQRLMEEKGYQMRHVGKEGWRRVVPSPFPLEICEIESLRLLLEAGCVVVAAGGGGIPVIRESDGMLKGLEAVIDKDLVGQKLARDVDAENFLILTNVSRVALDFGKPTERKIEKMTVSEARRHLREGQFPPGSMGPKVEAACLFVEQGGKEAIIGDLFEAHLAVKGVTGTRIIGDGSNA
ncbi:carbamate kinase [Clostridiales bacterium PH28_bin88]|nr:carbamate kinase [Clostridiales bacterium PH28_bin88]